ncbi:MAG TPA: cyanophycinase, partial [Pirellulales bacterium]
PSKAAYDRRDAVENREKLRMVDKSEPVMALSPAEVQELVTEQFLRNGIRQVGVQLFGDAERAAAPERLTPQAVALVREEYSGDMNDEKVRRVMRFATFVELAPGATNVPAGRLAELADALRNVVERGGIVMAQGEEAARLATEYTDPKTGDVAPGLNVLPGVSVRIAADDRSLEGNAHKHAPTLLGLTLPKTGAIAIAGRQFEVLEGKVELSLAASHMREAATQTLKAGDQLDFIELTRAAAERGRKAFPVAQPSEPRVENGSLVIVGGGGMPRGLLSRFVTLSGGPDALIVYIPCEEADEVPRDQGMLDALRRAGAKNVTWLHTKDRGRANDDEEFLAPLRSAGGIWFGGGRQWNLVDSYQNTTAHKLMQEVLERGGCIGGSSAGASIQSEYMPRGSPRVNTIVDAEGYEQGLAFLRGAAVDQHFTQRRRGPDLNRLIEQYPQYLGIGIDETTAIVVHGSRAEVVGDFTVNFFDARNGELQRTSLSAGAVYDLVERREVVEKE